MAVVGKGGTGKSAVAGTLARALARRGHMVLALDSDLMPGLALSLGALQPMTPPLAEAAERREDGRWSLRRGIGPARAVRRYSIDAPDGVRLLQCGKVTNEGLAPLLPALHAFYAVIHRLPEAPSLAGWAVVGDLSAGPRQSAFDWAPYARTFLVVVEPSWKSVLTARTIVGIARSRGSAVVAVANKAEGAMDARWVSRALGEPVLATLPRDDAVREADRLGVAPIDHAPESPFVVAVAALASRLEAA